MSRQAKGTLMATRAKTFDYSVSVGTSGPMTAEGGSPLAPGDAWTPEHLVLAGLCRCSLKSLEHSAARDGLTVSGEASASGVVTRRDEDGRFALVQIDVRLVVVIDPPPADLARLLQFAEKGCFVGSSLRASPAYHWTVNGSAVG
jgi:uncharacterized OsmC-like protein